jgi:ubiquinone/menaquinone biosynthesis C-methylase UbiE
MNLQQAHALIGPAATLLPHPERAQRWADLGCGSGLFTEALTQLLPKNSTVYGIDTKPSLKANLPHIIPMTADFVKEDLQLRDLDGILMANSLHYVKDKDALLKKLTANMREGSPFIIIEYDTDIPVSTWVPYPLSFGSLTQFFARNGYQHVEKLGQRPSVYGRSNIYAAIVK